MGEDGGTDSDFLATLGDPAGSLEFTTFGFRRLSPTWPGYRDRILPDHFMYLLTDGACTGTAIESAINLTRGSFLWMQPRIRHTIILTDTKPSATLYHVRFRLTLQRRELAIPRAPVWQRDNAWDLFDLMDQLLDELRSQLPYRLARLRGLLLAICGSELRHRHTIATPTTGILSRAQRRSIETYVQHRLAEWPSAQELADHVGLSHDYFTRLFSRTFGVPPRTWLLHERLKHGAQLLTESLQNITQIAKALGYADVSAFSHQFKQLYGVGPRTYRRSHR